MDDPQTSGSSIAEVEYSVELRPRGGADAGRTLEELHVRRVLVHEQVHASYRIELTLVTDDVAIDVDGLVGAELMLRLERPERDAGHAEAIERVLHGVVLSAAYLGTRSDRLHVRVIAGPAFELLGSTLRSRVFQGESVPELVQRIVEESLAPWQRRVDVTRLQHEHPPRDYCVQFRESDRDFVERVLAEDGITIVFTHDDEREQLVLVDEVAAFTSVYGATDGPRELSMRGSELGPEETIAGFGWSRRVRSASTPTAAWDWKRDPPQVLHAEHADGSDASAFGEHYVHDARRSSEGSDGTGPHEDRVAELAAHRFAAMQALTSRATGHGNVIGLAAGHTFALIEHPHDAFDDHWLVLRVVHEGDCPEADIHDADALGGSSYENHFEAVPLSRDFRPQHRDKPRIFGHQLASVVGPPGEEIHTDEHGRIKVWFHWDREGKGADPDTSCWLRVAQLWAGPGFGAMFVPRVGMEVVVSFIDGDPDRPLCIGCVYDGHNRPPWPLPEQRTHSGIKTASSPGGEGFNALRFEDAKGSEQVWLHAQRDLDEQVKRAHTMHVGSTQSIHVGSKQRIEVGSDREITVTGNHTMLVKGTPPMGVPAGYELTVIGDIKTSATKKAVIVAPLGIDLVCGPTTISLTPTGITLVAGSGAVIKLDAALAAAAAGGAVQLAMDQSGKASLGSITGASVEIADDVVAKSPAGSRLVLDGGAMLGAVGGAKVQLDAGALVSGATATCHSNAARLVLDGDALLQGPKVVVAGASGTLVTDAQGIKLEGPRVATVAAGSVSLLGPVVKMN